MTFARESPQGEHHEETRDHGLHPRSARPGVSRAEGGGASQRPGVYRGVLPRARPVWPVGQLPVRPVLGAPPRLPPLAALLPRPVGLHRLRVDLGIPGPGGEIQAAVGSRIEPRSISVANTAPQPVAAGGGGKGRRFAVVAPAREVNAAVAAGPRESAGPAPSSRAEKAPKVREAPPTQARGQAREAAPVQQRQPKAQKSREAPPAQAREAAPMEQRQPKEPKREKFREA